MSARRRSKHGRDKDIGIDNDGRGQKARGGQAPNSRSRASCSSAVRSA
jgi:hypothetical protein